MRLLGRVLSELLELLAPPGCAACDRPVARGVSFCLACAAHEPAPLLSHLDGVPLLTAGCYRPPLSTAIIRFKYAGRAELARPLAGLLLPSVSSLALPPGSELVPVPLHPRRLAARGYNQAALLARELSRHTLLTCRARLLERCRETQQQVGRSRHERQSNAMGAFVLRQRRARRVILIDDVVTTGSTVRACAQALATGGVEVAAIVALARAEPT